MHEATAKSLTETDLYPPIHRYLVAQGYTVRSEVRNCDIAAAKGDELILIELKRNFSTDLLIQATRRQRTADAVYVALPRPESSRKWRERKHLLRRLELGLIWVSFDSGEPEIEVVFHPLPFQRRRRKREKRDILREVASRSGDYNTGGSSRRKIATAYRESAIHIACFLDTFGELSPRQLRSLGTGPKTSSILYSNFYGWFDRVARGVYGLRPQARTELAQYPELAQRYRALVRKRGKADHLLEGPTVSRARGDNRSESTSRNRRRHE